MGIAIFSIFFNFLSIFCQFLANFPEKCPKRLRVLSQKPRNPVFWPDFWVSEAKISRFFGHFPWKIPGSGTRKICPIFLSRRGSRGCPAGVSRGSFFRPPGHPPDTPPDPRPGQKNREKFPGAGPAQTSYGGLPAAHARLAPSSRMFQPASLCKRAFSIAVGVGKLPKAQFSGPRGKRIENLTPRWRQWPRAEAACSGPHPLGCRPRLPRQGFFPGNPAPSLVRGGPRPGKNGGGDFRQETRFLAKQG